jgi:hypothetical protein
MTEIEALLSVDGGHTPPGTVAFFLDDGTRGFRSVYALLAAAAGATAVAGGWAGWGRAAVVLLLLMGLALALSALPTLSEDENRDPKRQVLVITASGLIVRDDSGLRSWRFEDLTDVVAGIRDSQPYLKLIDHQGKRHIVGCAAYRKGERARRAISARLHVRRTNPG